MESLTSDSTSTCSRVDRSRTFPIQRGVVGSDHLVRDFNRERIWWVWDMSRSSVRMFQTLESILYSRFLLLFAIKDSEERENGSGSNRFRRIGIRHHGISHCCSLFLASVQEFRKISVQRVQGDHHIGNCETLSFRERSLRGQSREYLVCSFGRVEITSSSIDRDVGTNESRSSHHVFATHRCPHVKCQTICI